MLINTCRVDGIQEDVTVNCKDCSIDGAIEITEGELTVSDATTFPTKAKAFIDYGYFKAVANGVIAHVELDTTLSLSNTQSFDTTIATIPLTGFQVSLVFASREHKRETDSRMTRFQELLQLAHCSNYILQVV